MYYEVEYNIGILFYVYTWIYISVNCTYVMCGLLGEFFFSLFVSVDRF